MAEPVKKRKKEEKYKAQKAIREEKRRIRELQGIPSPEKKSRPEKKPRPEKKLDSRPATYSLLAEDKALDPTLSSLFAVAPTPPVSASRTLPVGQSNGSHLGSNDANSTAPEPVDRPRVVAHAGPTDVANKTKDRKRKRKDDAEEIEDAYMRRLAREDARDSQEEVKRARQSEHKIDDASQSGSGGPEVIVDLEDDGLGEDTARDDDIEDINSPPPKHITEQAAELDVSKANRTVFLGNVSTAAITSNASRRELLQHLKSFFEVISKPKDDEPKHSIESIRFRSTPYASAAPKKAAYAKKELMDATTKSTNAYAVYSSQMLAREAAKRLNGTTVLARHLRVDEVAHPTQVDHRRCVFVGNLGFVDDESNIQAADAAEGRQTTRRPAKQPADAEEGLWRSFASCGTVEGVRVVRDSKTRVGKGIAYVQFTDETAVERALLLDGKTFPPLLPRRLRVSRAKAPKRNAKPGSGRPSSMPTGNAATAGYQRKITNEEASHMGRAGRLLGRAAAAQIRRPGKKSTSFPGVAKQTDGLVFEGNRASSDSKVTKEKKRKRKGGKPTGRSARRGAAFKAAQKA